MSKYFVRVEDTIHLSAYVEVEADNKKAARAIIQGAINHGETDSFNYENVCKGGHDKITDVLSEEEMGV